MRYQQNEANATINGVSNDYFDVKGLVFKDGQTLINVVSVIAHRMWSLILILKSSSLVTVPTLSVK